ncbi:hypothetical protein J2X61_004274 [Bacillus sp. 3255]|nr:hypothetical protein [Bacillus sp. 3255]
MSPFMKKAVFACSLVSISLMGAVSSVQATSAAVQPETSLQDTPVLAATPPMGYSTWNAVRFNVNEELIRNVADSMVSTGLRDLGYNYVNIDDGWQGTRDATGKLNADLTRFPSGMKALADYVHSKGLKIGIYTDIGKIGCGGKTGSYGHYQQDVDQFAEWGYDYVKVDACGADAMGLDFKTQYQQFKDALNQANPKRDILLNICEWGKQQPWKWAPSIGHTWRVGYDIDNQGDYWNGVLYEIDQTSPHADVAGPGHFNDPDSLEVGVIADKYPGQKSLSYEESKANFSMWAVLASPLMLGLDVTALDDPDSYSSKFADIIQNAEVIAVDQDPAGIQGILVSETGGLQVWAKELSKEGTLAIALLNRTDSAANITVDFAQVGLDASTTVRDLWEHADKGQFNGSYTANVPSHGVVMLKLEGKEIGKPQTPFIPQSQMTAAATSEELESEDNGASMVLDGDPATIWHTKWDLSNPLPQSITLNLGGAHKVNKIKVHPRQGGGSNGMITAYNVYTSTDGIQYTKVVSGTWAKDAVAKTAEFPATRASFIKLEATAGQGGWASAAEMNVYRIIEVPVTGVQLNTPQVSLKEGRTAELVATVLPENATNKNVTWSSSNDTVAKVEVKDGKTVVTALKEGVADITVTTVGGNFTAVSKITVQKGNDTQNALTTLSAAGTVQTGQEFTVQLGLGSVTQSVYAEDMKMDYDSNVFDFVSARAVKDGIQLVDTKKDTLGKLRFILASEGADKAVTGDAGILELKFKAKAVTQPTTGTIAVTDAMLGDAQGAETKAQASAVGVSITTSPPGIPGDINHDNRVSIGDLGIVAANYGKTSGSPDWESIKHLDSNHDGKIDITDLAFIARKIIE